MWIGDSHTFSFFFPNLKQKIYSRTGAELVAVDQIIVVILLKYVLWAIIWVQFWIFRFVYRIPARCQKITCNILVKYCSDYFSCDTSTVIWWHFRLRSALMDSETLQTLFLRCCSVLLRHLAANLFGQTPVKSLLLTAGCLLPMNMQVFQLPLCSGRSWEA